MPTAAKAAALTGEGELTYASWPIEKWEEQDDGSLIVYGKATTPEVDSDEQIVDSEWSAKALQEWYDTGPNLRVQHNPQRDPAGSGLKIEINRDGDGAHYVRALVDEPVAVKLVKKGHLRAYSVGISRPQIVPDPTGKARGGIIKGGKFAEVSLVDRPANSSCTLQLVKAAGDDGHAEWTGKLDGDADMLAKADEPDLIKGTVAFKPSDLAKLLDLRGQLEKADAKDGDARDGEGQGSSAQDGGGDDDADGDEDHGSEWSEGDGKAQDADAGKNLSQGERDKMPASDFAYVDSEGGKHLPVHDEGHVRSALGRFHQQDFSGDSAARKKAARKIIAAARSHGIAVDDDSDVAQAAKIAKAEGGGDCKLCRGTGKIRDGKQDCPDCEGSGEMAGKEAEPEVTKTGSRTCSSCGSTDHGGDDKFCACCGTKLPAMDADKAAKPNPGEGVAGEHTDPVPGHREPDGPAVESFEHDAGLPTDPDDSVAVKTLLRYKSAGVPAEEARLHDLLCPAYHPDDVALCHPGVSLAAAVDGGGWQGKALTATASAPLAVAQAAMHLWTDAETIKATSPDDLLDLRWEAFKTFMDAQSGPANFPTPSEPVATRFNRPLITDGREATAPGSGTPRHGGVPSGQTSAADFGRDYIEAGHASDSPQNDGQPEPPVKPPAQTGKPGRMYYRNSAKDQARQAMATMHDHIAATFPDLCPMHAPGRDPSAVGKTAQPEPEAPQAAPEPGAAAPAAPATAAKSAGDAERARLADLVLSGEVSVESARLALGLEVAAKADGPHLAKAAAAPDITGAIEAAVTKAVAPLAAELADARRQIEEMADQPDPHTAPWRGGALPAALKALSPAPGGQETAAQAQDRARAALQQELLETARSSPNPADREAAYGALFKMGGFPDMTKAHPLT